MTTQAPINYTDLKTTLEMRFPSAQRIGDASDLASDWIGVYLSFGSLTFVIYNWEENNESDWIVDTITDEDAESTIVRDFDGAVALIAAEIEL